MYYYQFPPFNITAKNFKTFSKFFQRRKIYEFLLKKMSNFSPHQGQRVNCKKFDLPYY